MTAAHEPTLITRSKVEAFACAGFAQPWIAKYLNIDEDTLVKYYKEELHNAKMDKLEMVASHAFRRAMENSDKMLELILRTQARWANAKSDEEIKALRDKQTENATILEQLADRLSTK